MGTKKFINVVQLRELMLEKERGLGLGHLSQNEEDVLYAINSVITARTGVAKSHEIKSHDLVFYMTQPTSRGCSKNLINTGMFAYIRNTKAVSYVLPQECDDAAESA